MLVRMAKDPDAWLYPCDDSEQILGRKNDPLLWNEAAWHQWLALEWLESIRTEEVGRLVW